MAHDTQAMTPRTSTLTADHSEHGGNRLGPLLCWGVVFANIGSDVYFMPGILYGQVGASAGLFVAGAMVALVLLALTYGEVSARFPEGGGVVTVSARGLNPWAGAVGGMFILVDYFLTSSISSLAGIQYLGTVFPALGDHLTQLVVTLVVLALLGLLNWYGVKESATVSLVFALAALLSDAAVVVAVLITVPLHTLGDIFAQTLRGRQLTGGLLLTGFAAAFLTLGGLESISQLSPVMRVPRSKTVNRALTLVVITICVTSPLLTVFSTTLLDAAHTDPTVFISKLGGLAGGPVLGVLTACTASTLLIFACNTTILSAYHVFLALSRVQFFPKAIEKTNRLRGTPHVAILLATGIPMAALVAVGGNIDRLAGLYAFGLLGAFSLTCLALDVIRWRERHGGAHIGETAEHEDREAAARRALPSVATIPFLQERLGPAGMERLWHLRRQMAERRAATARGMAPVVWLFKRLWPDVRYYLGYLTTVLVVVAWAVTLKSRPLATAVGSGLTLVGLSISVVHYRYQQSKGTAPVFLMPGLRRVPNSILVVLGPHAANNLAVARAAIESAQGRTLVFLYLGEPTARPVRAMAFNDPYLFDDEAQATLRAVSALSRREHVPAEYLYRVRGPRTVLDVWRLIRPTEIIADAEASKAISRQIAPDYVRYQQADGTRMAHYITHEAPEGEGDRLAGGFPSRRRPPRWREREKLARAERATAAAAERYGRDVVLEPPADILEVMRPTKSFDASDALDPGDYVWTGTELISRSDLPKADDGEETMRTGR